MRATGETSKMLRDLRFASALDLWAPAVASERSGSLGGRSGSVGRLELHSRVANVIHGLFIDNSLIDQADKLGYF